MAVRLQRPAIGTSTIDVLDRVLDKGIVIDAALRLSVTGITLVTIESRVLVASIETWLTHADGHEYDGPTSQPNIVAPTRPANLSDKPGDRSPARRRRR